MSVVQGKLNPIKDHVLVTDMEFNEVVTSTGIIIQSLNGKSEGIMPRWGRVYAVGPEQQDIKAGDWVCVEHGRWTRGVTIDDGTGEKVVRRVENESILLVADEKPQDAHIPK